MIYPTERHYPAAWRLPIKWSKRELAYRAHIASGGASNSTGSVPTKFIPAAAFGRV